MKSIVYASILLVGCSACVAGTDVDSSREIVETVYTVPVLRAADTMIIRQDADRRKVTVDLSKDGEVVGKVEAHFGAWETIEEHGETWQQPSDVHASITTADHIAEVSYSGAHVFEFSFDGQVVAETLDLPPAAVELGMLLRAVFDEDVLRVVRNGDEVSTESSVVRQASTGVARHQYAKKLLSIEPNNEHYYDFTYIENPYWTGYWGRWDCFIDGNRQCWMGNDTGYTWHVEANGQFSYLQLGDGAHHELDIHTSSRHVL